MLILVSPTKSLNFEPKEVMYSSTQAVFTQEANRLAKKMRTFSVKNLRELMKISPDLAQLNWERYQSWSPKPKEKHTKQALFAFTGEVFRGLNANEMGEDDLEFTQNHLRILSGLYGVLKPLDLIQAYRLEMGTRLKYYHSTNLYQFWGDKILKHLKTSFKETETVINLASNEYFKSVNASKLNKKVITPMFKDYVNGEYKMVMVYAKYARGLMTRYIIDHKIHDPELLKGFSSEGYFYDANLSDDTNWVFLRS